MEEEAEEGAAGALECSCNQGLCAQEGPINPAVCLYISSGILKTAKNVSPGPGSPPRAAERERERATGGVGPDPAAEDDTVLKTCECLPPRPVRVCCFTRVSDVTVNPRKSTNSFR